MSDDLLVRKSRLVKAIQSLEEEQLVAEIERRIASVLPLKGEVGTDQRNDRA